MDQQELKNVLEKHRKWFLGEPNGERANLSSANLSSADLSSANLSSANLRSANLSYANLSEIKEDFFKVLLIAKNETLGLYDSLMRGKIDGSVYVGECACLVGTIAKVRREHFRKLEIDLKPNAERLAEKWFLGIAKDDIPQSNQISSITADWMREFMDTEKIKYPRYEIMAIQD